MKSRNEEILGQVGIRAEGATAFEDQRCGKRPWHRVEGMERERRLAILKHQIAAGSYLIPSSVLAECLSKRLSLGGLPSERGCSLESEPSS